MKARLAAIGALIMGVTLFGAMAATGARAGDSVVKIPAPQALADGAAATVGNLVSVGQSGAGANSTNAGASATPLSVLGKPIIGGAQAGNGQKTGALIDTGNTPLGRIQVLPYGVAASQTATKRQAGAQSAAARVDVLKPDFIHVDVLQSASSATHVGSLSRGQAVSDGVVVRLGGPEGTIIRILHSEADATGQGRTYLLAVGNNALIDNDVLDAACSLDLGPVLNVACMQVAGGVGGLTSSVLEAAIGGVNGLHVGAITALGTGGTGDVVEGSRVLANQITATPTAKALARTGTNVWFLAFVAEALVALGAVTLAATKTFGLVPARVTQ
ncbi:MAG TPA: hypothetical protein VFB78_09690 [Acidimicrobiales bacterium]|nr:hypothetical protein [Acidimicrobiales bacterium]